MSWWGFVFYVSVGVVYLAVGATVVGWIRSAGTGRRH